MGIEGEYYMYVYLSAPPHLNQIKMEERISYQEYIEALELIENFEDQEIKDSVKNCEYKLVSRIKT